MTVSFKCTSCNVIYYIVIIVVLSNFILLFYSKELEMTYCVSSDNSLTTDNSTLVTTVDNNYALRSESNKDVTEWPNHTHAHDVSSSYSKWLSESRIISGSLLKLQETIGQGIVNSYI